MWEWNTTQYSSFRSIIFSIKGPKSCGFYHHDRHITIPKDEYHGAKKPTQNQTPRDLLDTATVKSWN